MSPNVIEIGRAGRALLYMASNISVRERPIRTATKQAIVVFQSPDAEAFPIRTLLKKCTYLWHILIYY